MSALPRMGVTTYANPRIFTDAAFDIDGFLRANHVDALARKGYAPVGEIEIRRSPDGWLLPRDEVAIATISETAVSWRAEA